MQFFESWDDNDDDFEDDDFKEVGRDEIPFWLVPSRSKSDIKLWNTSQYSTHDRYLKAKTNMESSTEALHKGWVRGQISKYSGKVVYFTFSTKPSEQELRDLAFDVAIKFEKKVERVVYDYGNSGHGDFALSESAKQEIREAVDAITSLVENLLVTGRRTKPQTT